MAAVATTVVEMRSHASRLFSFMRSPFSLRLVSLWDYLEQGGPGQSIPLDEFATQFVRSYFQDEVCSDPLDRETWWIPNCPVSPPTQVEDHRYGQSGGTVHPRPERPKRGVPSRPEPGKVRPEVLHRQARDQGPNRSTIQWQDDRHFLVFLKWNARPRSTTKRVQLPINAPLARHKMSLCCGPPAHSGWSSLQFTIPSHPHEFPITEMHAFRVEQVMV
jgi:hypothetical protein